MSKRRRKSTELSRKETLQLLGVVLVFGSVVVAVGAVAMAQKVKQIYGKATNVDYTSRTFTLTTPKENISFDWNENTEFREEGGSSEGKFGEGAEVIVHYRRYVFGTSSATTVRWRTAMKEADSEMCTVKDIGQCAGPH